MPKKKELEIPVAEDVALHMEFLEGDAVEKKEPDIVPLSADPDCSACFFGPPDRRAFTECESAMRRGNALGCGKFMRKV